MRLVNSVLDFDIVLEEGNPFVLIIENKRVFSQVVNQLWKEVGGETGDWVLSNCEKSLSLSKNVDIVFNPYSVNPNDRKVLAKLYSELSDIVSEKYRTIFEKANGNAVELLSLVTQDAPYFLRYDLEVDMTSILKMFNVQIDSDGDSLLEKLIDYIRAYNNICRISIFVFVNLKDYLEIDELEQLYEFAQYEKANLLLIEGRQSEILKQENTLIYDKDMCIITI